MHLQTEKQRLIWAYKILFLDVLFPLNLRKVIFCDSDQVVRGDMAELWNLDLHVSHPHQPNFLKLHMNRNLFAGPQSALRTIT